MRKILYTVILCGVAIVSCQKQDISQLKNNNQIRFVTNITKATATAFEAGDKMSVWAVEQPDGEKMPIQLGGNFINNECLTFDGANWNAPEKLCWSEKPCDFIAVYPYLPNVTSVEKQQYSLPVDQNAAATADALGGYESADVLFAHVENVSKEDDAVRLDFYHLLSKCSVNVNKGEKFEGEIPDDIVVHIYNTVTEYTLNLVKGSVSTATFGSKKTISMRKKDNQHFDAIVVPQNIELSTPLIEVTMGGIAYLLNYSLSFKPAYNHTINLTLNTSPDQEQIEIAIDPGVNPWE